jgi:hypothetical protein
MGNENEQKVQGEIGGNETNYDGSDTTALQRIVNDATQLKVDKTLLGDNLYEFWFGKDAETDIREVLGDCISRSKWESLLTKYKDGVISSDEMIDALLLSHMTVLNEETQNPFASAEEIMERAIESKFRGKMGRKLIANTIDALAETKLLAANPEAIKALVDQSITKSDDRTEEQKQNQLLIPDLKQAMPALVDNAFDKYMKSFAVADQIRDITVTELVARLSDADDAYFSPVHHLVFDIGWEAPSRLKADEKCLALYVAELDRAWVDEASSNVKTSDRRITRYLVRDIKRGETEKLDQILTALMMAYKGRLEEKATFVTVLWGRGL